MTQWRRGKFPFLPKRNWAPWRSPDPEGHTEKNYGGRLSLLLSGRDTLPGTVVAVAFPGARLCFGIPYSTPCFSVWGVCVSRGRGASPRESDLLVLVSFTECEKVSCLTTLNKRRNNCSVQGIRDITRSMSDSGCLTRGTSQKHVEGSSQYTCWAHPKGPESDVVRLKPPPVHFGENFPRGFCWGRLVKNQELEELGSLYSV